MQTPHRFQAPQLTGDINRASEVFGAAVWLWMHLPRQRQLPIRALEKRLLEPVQQGQYVLASAPRNGCRRAPVALLLYACLSEQAESRHLHDPDATLAPEDWRSGDRLWLIDWVSPFGHLLQLRRPMLELFARQTARSLHRRGAPGEQSLTTWRGNTCTPEGARVWWRDRPAPGTRQPTAWWHGAANWAVTVPGVLLPHSPTERLRTSSPAAMAQPQSAQCNAR